MLVMHDPINTSSTCRRPHQTKLGIVRIIRATDNRFFDFSQINFDHRSYSALASAAIRIGWPATLPSCGHGARGCVHRRSLRRSSSAACDVGAQVFSPLSLHYILMVQPAAERSAEASDNSKACSTVRSHVHLQSRECGLRKKFFLPFFSTVSRPCFDAV